MQEAVPAACHIPGQFKYGIPEVDDEEIRRLRQNVLLSPDEDEACFALSALIQVDGGKPVKAIQSEEMKNPRRHYICESLHQSVPGTYQLSAVFAQSREVDKYPPLDVQRIKNSTDYPYW